MENVVNRLKWRYRVGFIICKSLLIWLLFSVPSTSLVSAHDEINLEKAVLLAFFVVLSTIAFYLVQGSDPGYITRDSFDLKHTGASAIRLLDDDEDPESDNQAWEQEIQYRQERISRIEIELAALEDPTEEKTSDEPQARMPFCAVCGLEPPLRSHHCKYCDKCVATYDHHCFCIGTCIGERNHCRFWWFLLFETFELILAILITHSSFHSSRSFYDWIMDNSIALAAACVFWTFALVVVPLWGFHTFIMCTNLTSYEVGKGPDRLPYLRGMNECDLPFSNGLINNLMGFCCARDGCWGILGRKWTPHAWKPPG